MVDQLAKNLSKSFGRLFAEFTDLKVSTEHILTRLHALEEKERERARQEHNTEIHLDDDRFDVKGC